MKDKNDVELLLFLERYFFVIPAKEFFVIPAKEFFVIPAKEFFVIPAKAGIQYVDPRFRWDDG
ncbi:MAG: hypothetical protein KJ588_02600 [Gammaproteobacteria bacterium]|nr:hypothetical protein [Gammaproteobacteria bacterium]